MKFDQHSVAVKVQPFNVFAKHQFMELYSVPLSNSSAKTQCCFLGGVIKTVNKLQVFKALITTTSNLTCTVNKHTGSPESWRTVVREGVCPRVHNLLCNGPDDCCNAQSKCPRRTKQAPRQTHLLVWAWWWLCLILQGSKGYMRGANMSVPTMSSVSLLLLKARCPQSWPTTKNCNTHTGFSNICHRLMGSVACFGCTGAEGVWHILMMPHRPVQVYILASEKQHKMHVLLMHVSRTCYWVLSSDACCESGYATTASHMVQHAPAESALKDTFAI